METRANYVLIGACALVGDPARPRLLRLAGEVPARPPVRLLRHPLRQRLRPEPGRRRALQRPVGRAGACRSTSPATRHGRVRVRIEVAADTPIPEGATAQLQAQGVTGVSFVSITPRRRVEAAAPRHDGGRAGDPGQRSVVQSLTEDAPDLLEGVDQAGAGVPEDRRRGEPGARRGDPRQRRAGLRAPSDGADRLLVDLASVAAGDRPDLGVHRQARADRRGARRARSARPRRRWSR